MGKFAILCISIFIILQSSGQIRKDLTVGRKRYVVYPPPQAEHFVLGYKDATADLFWLRFLQDYDFCDQKPIETRSFNLGGNLSEVLKYPLTPGMCDRGWAYHMLDLVTTLAPRFLLAYRTGTTTLSLFINDREGARLLFEKGIRQFPHDWVLAFRASHHYIYEIQNPERAAELLVRAKKVAGPEAPWWLPYLAASLYSKTGQLELSRKVINDFMEEHADDPKMVESAKIKLRNIERELAEAKSKENSRKPSTKK